MSGIINLNRVRKRAARELAEKDATAKRVKFGRTKTARKSDKIEARKIDNMLEQHRIDRKDEP